MNLSARLLRLASSTTYNPTRVKALQEALAETEGQPYNVYMPELWERFAESPLTDIHVSVQPEPYVTMPLLQAVQQERAAKPLLSLLAMDPRTLSTALELVLEMENRECTLDMQPDRVRSGLPTRLWVLFPEEEPRATTGIGFILERAVAMYEEAGLGALPLEGRSAMFDELEQVVVEPDALETERVQEMLNNVRFESLRNALTSAFKVLQGKSLQQLGCKNPYEPELALRAMGLRGDIYGGNTMRLTLPPTLRWALP